MAESGTQEKTEAPTQKKREDARKEGQVAVSKEVSSSILLGVFLIYLLVAGKEGLLEIERIWITSFQELSGPDLTIGRISQIFTSNLWLLSLVLFGLFALIFVIALLTSVMQVGIHVTGLKFQWSRLSPLKGLKRIFSMNGLAELLKGLFKMGIIVYITYLSISAVIGELLTLAKMPLGGIFQFNFDLLTTLFGRVALALVILAVFDFLFQRWNFEQQIKMTKQEVKDEMKRMEGDPLLKQRRVLGFQGGGRVGFWNRHRQHLPQLVDPPAIEPLGRPQPGEEHRQRQQMDDGEKTHDVPERFHGSRSLRAAAATVRSSRAAISALCCANVHWSYRFSRRISIARRRVMACTSFVRADSIRWLSPAS